MRRIGVMLIAASKARWFSSIPSTIGGGGVARPDRVDAYAGLGELEASTLVSIQTPALETQ